MSLMEIALPLALEKTSAWSSSVAWGPGTALTAGSLTGVTLMVEVATPLWAATEEPSSEDSTLKLPARLVCRSG